MEMQEQLLAGGLILAVLLLLGLYLVLLGLLHDRSGKEPICRRCRYSLEGIRDPVCPECGARLVPGKWGRKSGMVRGHRRRRWGVVATGAALMAPAMAVAFLYLSTLQWAHFKPTFYLIWELQDPATAEEAMELISRRYSDDRLSARTIRTLAEQGLNYRDASLAPGGLWRPEYAAFIDLALDRGLLTPEQVQDRWKSAVKVFWSDPAVRQFEGAPENPMMSLIFLSYAAHGWAAPRIDFRIEHVQAVLDGEMLDLTQIVRAEKPTPHFGRSAIVELPTQWETGRLELEWRIVIFDFDTGELMGEPWEDSVVLDLTGPIRGGMLRRERRPDGTFVQPSNIPLGPSLPAR